MSDKRVVKMIKGMGVGMSLLCDYVKLVVLRCVCVWRGGGGGGGGGGDGCGAMVWGDIVRCVWCVCGGGVGKCRRDRRHRRYRRVGIHAPASERCTASRRCCIPLTRIMCVHRVQIGL